MPFTAQEVVDIRRHCGFGFLGSGATNLMYFNWFAEFNTFEYRIGHLQETEITVVQTNYLPTLNCLEMQTASAAGNMDTSSASVWTWNKNEVNDRIDLYRYYAKRLVAMLGLPHPGPYFDDGGSQGCRMIV